MDKINIILTKYQKCYNLSELMTFIPGQKWQSANFTIQEFEQIGFAEKMFLCVNPIHGNEKPKQKIYNIRTTIAK